jgi:MSHA biogenesis protein MshK
MAGGLSVRGAALVLAVLAGSAHAIDDPTRPPDGLRTGPARSAPADALVLQSVIIGPSSRSAIISGEHVTLGGKIGAARLVKVNEASVVLLIGGSQRRLELYPGIEKHPGAQGATGK